MTPAREAIVLPSVFITVAALGGLRVGDRVQLVAPPLVSLVLGALLVGALVRGAVLAPDRLMSVRRSALENLNGLVVLLSLCAACAQVFTLVTPDSGLLHAVFSVAFFVQLATTLAGIREPRPLLRSLAILLGAAFVLRFLVLDTLYAPHASWGQRVLTALLEGASLGAIAYEPTGTVTGYVAFAALALYLAGLVLLPRPSLRGGDNGQLQVRSRAGRDPAAPRPGRFHGGVRRKRRGGRSTSGRGGRASPRRRVVARAGVASPCDAHLGVRLHGEPARRICRQRRCRLRVHGAAAHRPHAEISLQAA